MILTFKRISITLAIVGLLTMSFAYGATDDLLIKAYDLLYKNHQTSSQALIHNGQVYINLSDLTDTLGVSTELTGTTIRFTDKSSSVENQLDDDGNLYTGSLRNDLADGYGTRYLKEGGKYQGYWKDGLYEGQGTLVLENGNIYVGNFSKGFIHGQGKMFYPDGSYYKGSYQYGIQEGFGLLYVDKDNKYEGYWSNGLRNGKGKAYIDGLYKKGLWENNQMIKTLPESSFDF